MLLLIFLGSCKVQNEDSETVTTKSQQMYVVSQGWHSGVVVPAGCIPDSLWPASHDFSDYAFLQIGWGDKDFYQNRGFNLWYGTKAVVWPTSSALQVMGLRQITNLQYYADQTVSLEISREGYTRLCAFLQNQFQQNDSSRFVPLEEGLYQNSRFFLGSQSYYFPKNSNVWTARALKEAGIDITPIWYQTQKSLLNKLKKEGELLYPEH